MSALWSDGVGITSVQSGKQRTLGNFNMNTNTHGRMDWAAK